MAFAVPIIAEVAGMMAEVGIPAMIADVAAPALFDAAGGALISEVTGGDPLKGALMGGITGGLGAGLGGTVADALGVSSNVGSALASGTGGMLGSAITGGNPLMGGLVGGLGSYAMSSLGGGSGAAAPSGSTPTTSSLLGGGGASAGGMAATGAPSMGGVDLTTAVPSALSGGADFGAPKGGGILDALSGASGTAPAFGPSVGTSTTPLSTPGLSEGGGNALGASSGGGGPGPSATDSTAPHATLDTLLQPANGAPDPLAGHYGAPSGAAGDISGPPDAAYGNVAPGTGSPAPKNTWGQIGSDLTHGKVGDVLSGLGGKIADNPMAAIGGLGLGYQLLQGQQKPQGMDALIAQLNTAQAQQAQLAQGILPAGVKSAVDQATQANLANTRAQYSRMGMGNSTMEAQSMQDVYARSASMAAELAQKLLQQGVAESNISAGLLEHLMASYQSQNQNMSNAIGMFARGLGGATA